MSDPARSPVCVPPTPDFVLSSSASSSRTAASSFVLGTPTAGTTTGGGHPTIVDPSSSSSSASTSQGVTPRYRRSSSFLSLASLSISKSRTSTGASGKEREQLTLPALASPTPVSGGRFAGPPGSLPPLLFPAVTRSPASSRPGSPYRVSPSPSLLTLTRPPTPLTAPPDTPAAVAARLFDRPGSSFDHVLPREVKLLVLRALLDLWIADEREGVAKGDRWVGEGAGRRELIKLSRVSKEWTTLVYDGTLWPTLSTSPFPFSPPAPSLSDDAGHPIDLRTFNTTNVSHLAAHAGRFVQSLCLRDVDLSSVELRHIGLELAGDAEVEHVEDEDEEDWAMEIGGTGLWELNLRSCRGVGEGAISQLVAKTANLTTVNLANQPVVTRSLVSLLATSCPGLKDVNLSRCPALIGLDILPLFDRRPALPLETLHLAGLARMEATVLLALGGAGSRLKSLDLSGTSMTDEGLATLVAITPVLQQSEDKAQADFTVRIHSRGRLREPVPQGETYTQRSFLKLQHLNLSSCSALTDAGIARLAHSTPAIRFLQLSGLGRGPAHLLPLEPEVPPPLARFLSTLPALEKVDLEDADAVDDDAVRALAAACTRVSHVVLSGCRRATATGLAEVVGSCKALRVLEADGTRISDRSVKEFVDGVRARSVPGAAISVLDSQIITRSSMVPLLPHTRPRAGQLGYAFSPFIYQSPDAASHESGAPLSAGRDELDRYKPILSCFWGWGIVDSVRKEVLRERRAREAALAAVAAAAAASTEAGDVPMAGKRERLSTIVGGRRLLGWRSVSGGSVVLLDSSASRSVAGDRRAISQPSTPVSGAGSGGGLRRRDGGGRGDDGRGCIVM